MSRRSIIVSSLTASAALAAPRVFAAPVSPRDPRTSLWTFDNLRRVGGHTVKVEGAPTVIATPLGRATLFNGVDDALFIDHHPLAGATAFTFEALFRPDGGAFEQRWFHLESIPPASVAPEYAGSRILFEVRVKDGLWWLDTFLKGDGYRAPLIDPTRTWPLRCWHHVAQTCDGTQYRAYVNGVLQAEAELAFKPQGPGQASIGMRYTRNWPFLGAVRQAAFTRDVALSPGAFVLSMPG